MSIVHADMGGSWIKGGNNTNLDRTLFIKKVKRLKGVKLNRCSLPQNKNQLDSIVLYARPYTGYVTRHNTQCSPVWSLCGPCVVPVWSLCVPVWSLCVPVWSLCGIVALPTLVRTETQLRTTVIDRRIVRRYSGVSPVFIILSCSISWPLSPTIVG